MQSSATGKYDKAQISRQNASGIDWLITLQSKVDSVYKQLVCRDMIVSHCFTSVKQSTVNRKPNLLTGTQRQEKQ